MQELQFPLQFFVIKAMQVHMCNSMGNGNTARERQHHYPVFSPYIPFCSLDDNRHGEITFVCLPSPVTWHQCIQQINPCVHNSTRVLRGPEKKKSVARVFRPPETSNHHCPNNVQVWHCSVPTELSVCLELHCCSRCSQRFCNLAACFFFFYPKSCESPGVHSHAHTHTHTQAVISGR